MTGNKSFTIQLNSTVYECIRGVAHRMPCTMSDIVREAISEWIVSHDNNGEPLTSHDDKSNQM